MNNGLWLSNEDAIDIAGWLGELIGFVTDKKQQEELLRLWRLLQKREKKEKNNNWFNKWLLKIKKHLKGE